MHNFILNGADTDSVVFNKSDGAIFTKEEQDKLLQELNSLFEEGINWEHDGVYSKLIYLKAKNYILYDGNKIKTKGSSLRDQKVEMALREMLDKMIESLVYGEPHQKLTDIYHIYIKEALNVQNIKRWSSKKTITDKVMTSPRTNETKVKDAIAGSEYKEADKVWLFFKNDESLCLAENFNGEYNKKRLLGKLFKKTLVFESVLPVKELFKNYSLKRNQKLLNEVI